MLKVSHLLKVLDSFSSSERVLSQLLEVVAYYIPADAIVLLKKEKDFLLPLEFKGISPKIADDCFNIKDHPRLERIVNGDTFVRFPSGSDLPDPYDHLIDDAELMYVHDCMGMPIICKGEVWGVMTFDSLEVNKFSIISDVLKEEIYHFITTVISAVYHLDLYVNTVNKEKFMIKNKIYLDSANQLVGESLATETARVNIFEAIDYSNVIIDGAEGVGKMLSAKNIHLQSVRAEEPFIVIDGMDDISPEEREKKLFGHAMNAFPEATQARMGQLELVNGGSVVLRNLHKLNKSLLERILNFVWTRSFCRLGSQEKESVEVSCIFLLNSNEEFSEKLRSKIHKECMDVYTFKMPTLEERREDISQIMNSCLRNYEIRFSIPRIQLDDTVYYIFEKHYWSGNIKELIQSLEIAILQAMKNFDKENETQLYVTIDDLDQKLANEAGLSVLVPVIEEGISFHDAIRDYQKDLVNRILETCDYNRMHAAIALQIDVEELNQLIEELSIAA